MAFNIVSSVFKRISGRKTLFKKQLKQVPSKIRSQKEMLEWEEQQINDESDSFMNPVLLLVFVIRLSIMGYYLGNQVTLERRHPHFVMVNNALYYSQQQSLTTLVVHLRPNHRHSSSQTELSIREWN
jgi:hypothetical protein